jgi:hypothetical protein
METNTSSTVLEPIDPARRLDTAPGHWQLWLATATTGLVGFVILALLLAAGADLWQFDQPVLAAVISYGPHPVRKRCDPAGIGAGGHLGRHRRALCSGCERAGSDAHRASGRWRRPPAW